MDRDGYIDLTGGEAKVLGNRGGVHLFRLNNPVGQELINANGEYEAEFVSQFGKTEMVELDTSDAAAGTLSFPVTIAPGTFRVRLINPRRTILMIEVTVQ